MNDTLGTKAAGLAAVGLVALSCCVQGGELPAQRATAAASRVAVLHARFGFRAEAETTFQPAPGTRATSHVRALARRAAGGTERTASVLLPRAARDEVVVEDEDTHLAVSFALSNVYDAPIEIAEGTALYAGAFSGADVVHRVRAEGTEDFVIFAQRPAREELAYLVDVSQVAGLRLVGNTLELLDQSGTPRLRVASPYVFDALAKRHHARLAVDGCAYDANPAGPWGRTVTAPGAARCTVRVSWTGDIAYPAMVDPAWTTTGSMTAMRVFHTSTLLASGKVLVAGGAGFMGQDTSAELYDAVTGTFAATGSMLLNRSRHSATALASGRVLIVGSESVPTAAELYDPDTGIFRATGATRAARFGTGGAHTASVLASGKVLIAGDNSVGSAEMYDPATGSFADAGTMRTPRTDHTATVLASGKVLIAGGTPSGGAGPATFLAGAELYDPATGTFADAGTMTSARAYHTASVLPSGQVLLAGGAIDSNTISNGTELYDPVAGTFSVSGPMLAPTGRFAHTASVLASGAVLLVGGGTGSSGPFPVAEIYDPATGWFSASPSVATTSNRERHTATVLTSGRVLVAGGRTANGYLATAELFNLEDGSPCQPSVPSECASGICVDGVCCATACDGTCRSCAPKTGACVTVKRADDPDTCTGQSTCDAAGACKLKAGQPCTADTDCAGRCRAGTCEDNGAALGSACTTNEACASGFCADGACSDRACSGQCEAGDVTPGTCAFIEGLPHGARPPCTPGQSCRGQSSQCEPLPTHDDAGGGGCTVSSNGPSDAQGMMWLGMTLGVVILRRRRRGLP